MLHHAHNDVLVALSVVVAIFASYTALDLANSVTLAKGRARTAWLSGGSVAMGVGIWSMHFVAMLAFHVPGVAIAYDVPLLILSVLVAIAASAIALHIVSREKVTYSAYVLGSLSMGAAISGMHYIGIASMRMAARVEWDWNLVALSILIAVTASFGALLLAFRLRRDISARGFWSRAGAGVVMGIAIAGMHYTAMAAMHFFPGAPVALQAEQLLATSGLAVAVIGTSVLILGIALSGSVVDRELARREAMTQQLQEALRSREEFLSIASHELKTPMTTMRLQTQMRQRSLKKGDTAAFTPEKLQKIFEADSRQLARLTRLIDDMLDISRISTGKLAIQRESVDLCDVVREMVDRLADQLEAAGCTVELVGCESAVGHWDRFRLEQVIVNLLTNGMRYGRGRPIRIHVGASGERAVLTVQDHGIGIRKEDQQRIFHRFERAVSAAEISGLGLGLYISRSIVEMHGGTIHVESEVGQGAEFVVELPLGSETWSAT